MQCIDLRARFGQRWRIDYEQPHTSRTSDPWYQKIRCTHGHICPWGGDQLAACTNKRGPIAGRLQRLSFTEVAQAGDDGSNVVFPVDHFEEIAKIMRPKRRRRMSEEQRQAAADRLAEFRFRPQPTRRKSA